MLEALDEAAFIALVVDGASLKYDSKQLHLHPPSLLVHFDEMEVQNCSPAELAMMLIKDYNTLSQDLQAGCALTVTQLLGWLWQLSQNPNMNDWVTIDWTKVDAYDDQDAMDMVGQAIEKYADASIYSFDKSKGSPQVVIHEHLAAGESATTSWHKHV